MDNLPDPDVLALEIVENLEAGLESFRDIIASLNLKQFFMNLDNYSIDDHIHRFAVWVAARAASTSRLSNAEVLCIIDTIHLKEEVDILRNTADLNDLKYRTWLREQVEKICEIVEIGKSLKRTNSVLGLALKLSASTLRLLR